MKHGWKTITLGMGVSLTLYLLLPLLCAYLMLHGGIQEDAAFAWTAVAAGLSAAVGMLICKRTMCGLAPTVLALFPGPLVQLLAAVLGYLTFPSGFAMGERRWLLFLIAYLSAVVIGVLTNNPKKHRRSPHARRRRA